MATQKRIALEKEYRKLAKRADQRLLRLQRYAEDTTGQYKGKYKGVTQFAYKRAMRDIRSWSGENATRFNTKPPSNTNQLKAKIKDIKKFLESASSTLKPSKGSKGIIGTYQKRVNTINRKYGTDFTWQSLAEFYESGINAKLDTILDSDTKMLVVASIRANRNKIRKALKKNQEIHLKIYDEEGKEDLIIENEVNNILSEYGFKDISELFV